MTLLEQLREIRANGNNNSGFKGICRYLYDEDRTDFKLMYKQWPKYSGDFAFPVPSPNPEGNPVREYLYGDTKNMWDPEHPYGALRYELLDWAIAQLEAQ